jgi:hypothetical protein
VGDVEPHRVAEVAHPAGDVVEYEWRIGFVGVEVVDHEQAPDAVGIVHPHVPKHAVDGRPPPRARVPLAPATDLQILVVQRRVDGAVAPRPVQRVVGVPGLGQFERRVVHRHRVEHHVVAELRAGGLGSGAPVPEDLPEVPVPVLVLAQVHRRVLQVHAAEQQPLVHQVAGIVAHRDRARGHEQRILGVPDLE